MRRMRSLNFPKISTSKAQSDDETAMSSPYHSMSGHSRDSSTASSASSPVPSTFSNPSHSRWPGSNSSLETTPESPVNVGKSPLHDLVEDPEERDDFLQEGDPSNPGDYCICDTTNCDHRKKITASPVDGIHGDPEWTQGDDQVSFSGLLGDGRSFKRRKSGDAVVGGNPKRHSRRWPSITKRWSDRKATTSLSNPTVRSAPPSRSSSLQSPSLTRSLASHLEPTAPLTPPATPARSRTTSITRPKPPPEPLDIKAVEPAEDPTEREAHSTTPLLPPILSSFHRCEEEEELQSPLQSPSVVPMSAHPSSTNTPLSSPASPGVATPSLSTKPSIASITIGHHRHPTSMDIPTMSISTESDPWAAKLGHANFTIYPEPYIPEICDYKFCNALLEDWETARLRYMRHAARITENYGPTSLIYRCTEQKWAEIDAQWRANLAEANAEAEACGQTPAFQSLAETQPVSRIPTLNDPQQPHKFPAINEDDIVGPMVQYAKASAKPAKKSTFLRIFTSPAALLGRRRPSV